MEKQTKNKTVRRKYDEGFKTEALSMVNSGRSIPDVARLFPAILVRHPTNYEEPFYDIIFLDNRLRSKRADNN